MKRGLLLEGKEQAAASGRLFPVYAPEDGRQLGEAARGGARDVDLAVVAARRGFAQWSGLPPAAREAVLLRASDLLQQHGEERFLRLIMDESGSTITKARFEIRYAVELLRTAAGEARRLYGETFPNDQPERLSMVLRQPLGVAGVIAPFNAPLALLVKMAAFPLAAGNAVVIKPSEETPFVALEFATLLLEAQLPPAAVAVVTGLGPESGAALAGHAGVDAIALTGSAATGRAVGAAGIARMCPMQLELGGKNPLLVLRDADPREAAATAAEGAFSHAGQICMANSRLIVERPHYEEFAQAMVSQAESLHLGALDDERTAYGPLINQAALEKLESRVRQACADGAQLLTGGEIAQGRVYRPTVLLDAPLESALWREELFGPVVCIAAAAHLEEAITLANDSDYGLSAAILTRDIRRGLYAARRIRSGAVHIGMHAFQSNALAPVGGVGMSGMGRSGGHYSTWEFTRLKWISAEIGGQAP